MAVDTAVITAYDQMLQAIANYYGEGSDVWNKVVSGNVTPKQMAQILSNTPEVIRYVNKNGELIAYDIKKPVGIKVSSNIGLNPDSNSTPATSSTTTIKVPGNTGNIVEGEFTEVPMASGSTKYTGGIAETAKASTISASVTASVVAAATATQLGFGITEKLYEKNPDFFKDNYLEILAPQAWKEIAYSGTDFGNLIYTLFYKKLPTVNSDGTWYVPEKAFAYNALYLQKSGVLKKDKTVEDIGINIDNTEYRLNDNFVYEDTIHISVEQPDGTFDSGYFTTTAEVACVVGKFEKAGDYISLVCASSKPFEIIKSDPRAGYSVKMVDTKYNHGGHEVYGDFIDVYYDNYSKYWKKGIPTASAMITSEDKSNTITVPNTTNGILRYTVMVYGTNVFESYTDGITEQENSTKANLSTVTSVDETLTELKKAYPELWNERIENRVLQEDGSVNTITYIPLPTPNGGIGNQPTTEGVTQNNPIINPDSEVATNTQISTVTQPSIGTSTEGVTNTVTPTVTPNPPTEGGGDTPPLVVPTGEAKALWSIYNPTLEQIKSLGSYLWSTNFIDSLLKLFNNPMEAVISLHKIFGTPPTEGTGNIKIGYLDTGILDVKLVSEQYFEVDCGSVDLPEYFGNVLDYGGYTNISLYLPFIGIVSIDNADIMRSTITIKYQIDVFTGACLAQVNVLRDAKGGVLYQYTGNCSVQYPLSSGSYLNIFSSALQGAVLGSIGGAPGAVVGGALGALRGGGASYERSGNFSGNAGAMGIKKPYLIISRPQTEIADNFDKLQGYASNKYTTLSNCKGYTKVLACHVDVVSNATQIEKSLIEDALKNGIIIN